eukprot:5690071-Pyramimonas_sp.AAC.1
MQTLMLTGPWNISSLSRRLGRCRWETLEWISTTCWAMFYATPLRSDRRGPCAAIAKQLSPQTTIW